jgi:hypothetical protein
MQKHIVWSPERGLPTKTHASSEEAITEAQRLAAKHPGVPFHVFAEVGTACARVDVSFEPFSPDSYAHVGVQTGRGPSVKLYDPAAKAGGHNPKRLTNDEVGVLEGWRLLEKDELWKREHVDGDGVEFYGHGGWVRGFHDICENSLGWTFRTRNPKNYYSTGEGAQAFVPSYLPRGSSAGEGYRFVRTDSEPIRSTDEANATDNFRHSPDRFSDGWIRADGCDGGLEAAKKRVEQKNLVIRRRINT